MQIVDFLVAINHRLQQDIRYLIRMEPGVQTPEETLANASGSCRDFGWLSGAGAAPSRPRRTLRLRLSDPAEARCRSAGRTLGHRSRFHRPPCLGRSLCAGAAGSASIRHRPLHRRRHLPLCATPHYRSAAPITGGFSAEPGTETSFDFEMRVDRIAEQPRVTLPFFRRELGGAGCARPSGRCRAQGQRCPPHHGRRTDLRLHRRLPGGRMEHRRGRPDQAPARRRPHPPAEAALRAGRLPALRPGQMVSGREPAAMDLRALLAQGRQADWQDPSLIAGEAPQESATPEHARELLEDLSERSAFRAPSSFPPMRIRRTGSSGGRAAENVDGCGFEARRRRGPCPHRARLRARPLQSSGYVLPVQRWQSKAAGAPRWASERWPLRRGSRISSSRRQPGRLPLPLSSLPMSRLRPIPSHPGDPGSINVPLPDPDEIAAQLAQPRSPRERERPEQVDQYFTAPARCARRCRSSRATGGFCVFMPPTERLEDYLELLASVEASAAALGLKVHVEGYPPPVDPRLDVIKVTPDPGVIEVNIHPSADWTQCVATTRDLYEDARQARLGTEKFMTDGRHTGTGGGNHVVVGGAHPADSPFLRRPISQEPRALLAAPSLAQLPVLRPLHRADQPGAAHRRGPARPALRARDRHVEGVAARLGRAAAALAGRRLFRNLLVDVTGNTHRAEICIDKLYSPDGPTGRLGLVEFRSFEMPPDYRMSLAQQLLLRALISWFWRQPQQGSLVRWGTQLHDRFMLPHFVWADFLDVLADLRMPAIPSIRSGSRRSASSVSRSAASSSVRACGSNFGQALEPGMFWARRGRDRWNGPLCRFLGRADAGEGRRFRPAPLCRRLQWSPDADDERGRLGQLRSPACASRPGSRPRACIRPFRCMRRWCSISSILVEPFARRLRLPRRPSGGRNYETFPVNSYEAEGAPLARFEIDRHDRWARCCRGRAPSQEFPLTLDLAGRQGSRAAMPPRENLRRSRAVAERAARLVGN